VSSGIRRVLLGAGGGILLLVVAEVGIYNWRLALAMRCKGLADHLRELEWRRDELLVDRAALLNPERLQQLGDSLGLGPVELTRFAVVDLSPEDEEGEPVVCME
jgi:hypothetical protein